MKLIIINLIYRKLSSENVLLSASLRASGSEFHSSIDAHSSLVWARDSGTAIRQCSKSLNSPHVILWLFDLKNNVNSWPFQQQCFQSCHNLLLFENVTAGSNSLCWGTQCDIINTSWTAVLNGTCGVIVMLTQLTIIDSITHFWITTSKWTATRNVVTMGF